MGRSAPAAGLWSSRPPTKKSEIRKPSTAAIATNLKPAWIPVANDSRTIVVIVAWAEGPSWCRAAVPESVPASTPCRTAVWWSVSWVPAAPALSASSSSEERVKIVVVIPSPIAPPAIWNM